MVDTIIVTALAFLHIISAVGWLGGVLIFVSVVGPGVRSLSPGPRLEFLAKVGPKANIFFVATATSTIIFGLALLSTFAVDLGWPMSVGMTLGLAAYLIGMGVTIPSFVKADRLAKETIASGQAGPPSPELMKAMRRATIGSTVAASLLVLTVVFMVATGFPI